jgi:histone deacetylase 6
VENCGVFDHACHGKCQSCDSDVKPSCGEVNGISSLIGSHTDGKASKENCGACTFTYDCADLDGCLIATNGSCMAVDELTQEFEREQAGATLEDLVFSNDEEDDDSDWDPASSLVTNRWFCLNCTMPNVDVVMYCLVRLFFW